MGSKSSRQKGRRKRKKQTGRAEVGALDVHGQIVMGSLDAMGELLADLLSHPDPLSVVDSRIDACIASLRDELAPLEPFSTIEVIRMVCLPFSSGPTVPFAGAQDGLTIAEMLTLAVVTATREAPPESLRPVGQETGGIISEKLAPTARDLLDLASAQDVLRAQGLDTMDQIAVSVRASGRWMRGSSYSEMLDETLRGLFGASAVDVALRAHVGFSVADALEVLNTCHSLQMDGFNGRGQGLAEAFNSIDMTPGRVPTEAEKTLARDALMALFAPTAHHAAVTLDALVDATGCDGATVRRIVEFFALPFRKLAIDDALKRFLAGDSPFQQTPLIWLGGDHVLLIHDASVGPAIKDGLESALRATDAWEAYQTHRGKYLERRIKDLLGRVMPGAQEWHDLEYFVPSTPAEENDGPGKYSKLVEGDHLFVFDDVAVIVEDKAIPLSKRSRTGEINPLRRNLASAIVKGADQASRLRDRIDADHGVRLRNGSWVDLSAVREVHTIVTSLDDLSGVSTATTQLARVGLLRPNDIPWTVSLHDLDLITQLIDRPAEFILYLRRRRHAQVTAMYMAVDELDLFLYFFRAGLYVEPDPDAPSLESELTAKGGSGSRPKARVPAVITSHTDQLDAWYNALHPPEGHESQDVEKPSMTAASLDPLIETLSERGVFASASIGATLLGCAEDAQRRLASLPRELLSRPDPQGRERSVTVPVGTSLADAWLLVWMTRPPRADAEAIARKAQTYMIAKKHQLGIQRGAAFVYDEVSGDLYAIAYDGEVRDLDPEQEAALVQGLRPVGDMQTWAQMRQSVSRSERSRGHRGEGV